MTFLQALRYFVREAALNFARSWKTSVLAVLTISISLFVGGGFLWVTGNLAQKAEEWSRELLVTVYLEHEVPDGVEGSLEEALDQPWVAQVRPVSGTEAKARFAQAFPALAEVFEHEEGSFSPSREVVIDPGEVSTTELDGWIGRLRELDGVQMVDDDRDWLAELRRVLVFARGLGAGVGLGLLAAAVLTIASVIKLTAYLYLEEIEVQRLVGATEFFIRGPFYMEGILQGLVGGAVALTLLSLLGWSARAGAEDSFWLALVVSEPLPVSLQALLIAVGAASGLLGAVISLRRESLRAPEA